MEQRYATSPEHLPGMDTAELRRRVTSPGGTTERAVAAFENAGLRSLVLEAMRAAESRAVEMSKELGAES